MLKFVVLLTVLGVALGLPTDSNKTDVAPRIVGGDETDIAHNPWTLALLYNGRQYCGAVEISAKWALTAAHCLEGVEVDRLSVRAGSTTRSRGGQVTDVVRRYDHPEFNRRTVDYDFALLELSEPITVQTAAPIALPEPGEEYLPGDRALMLGWGLQSAEGTASEILHEVEISVISLTACQEAHRFVEVTRRMFCAGGLDDADGGKDFCKGDDGGPVIVNGKLAGLISWGNGCGRPYIPAVFARVSTVLEWIYETSGI